MGASAKAKVLALAKNPALTDEEVVEHIKAGEPALFEVLMRRHNRRVYRTIRAILRDEAEVEDAMQQTYVAAFAHLAQFRASARFSTWLVRIALNEALARTRRRQHRTEEIMDDEHDAPSAPDDPEREAHSAELRTLLEAAVEVLPETYRVVFMLRDVEGLDTAEAAEALGVSEDVIKQRLHRARAMLRKDLFARAGGAVADAFSFDDRRCDAIVARVFDVLGGSRS